MFAFIHAEYASIRRCGAFGPGFAAGHRRHGHEAGMQGTSCSLPLLLVLFAGGCDNNNKDSQDLARERSALDAAPAADRRNPGAGSDRGAADRTGPGNPNAYGDTNQVRAAGDAVGAQGNGSRPLTSNTGSAGSGAGSMSPDPRRRRSCDARRPPRSARCEARSLSAARSAGSGRASLEARPPLDRPRVLAAVGVRRAGDHQRDPEHEPRLRAQAARGVGVDRVTGRARRGPRPRWRRGYRRRSSPGARRRAGGGAW